MGQDASLPTSSISDRKKGPVCLKEESLLNALAAAQAATNTAITSVIYDPSRLLGRPPYEDQVSHYFFLFHFTSI